MENEKFGTSPVTDAFFIASDIRSQIREGCSSLLSSLALWDNKELSDFFEKGEQWVWIISDGQKIRKLSIEIKDLCEEGSA